MVGVQRLVAELPERRGRLLSPGSRCAAALAAGLVLAGCALRPAPPAQVVDGRPSMGTLLEIRLVGPAEAPLRQALEACFGLAAELDGRFTTWNDTSELARLNAAAGGEPVALSPALGAILADARVRAQETHGVFDVTVGPLIRLWREAAERGALPSEAALAAARARVGAGRIELLPDGRGRLPAGAAVDLGGLAKGWALDRMAGLLRERGVERGLLSFGGSSVLALGAPPDAPAWRVLVRSEQGRDVGVVELRDRHLSVSESLGRSTRIAGRRFGHVVDPRSGWPVQEGRLAAVVARSGARAEALSTALLVVPPAEGIAWARPPDEQVLVVDAAGGRHASPGFVAATHFRELPRPAAGGDDG